MSVAEKFELIADEVYEAGQKSEYDRFWDAYQNKGTRTNYWCAFAGMQWDKETFKPKYKIAPVGSSAATQMFLLFNGTTGSEIMDYKEYEHLFDWSGITAATQTFQDAKIENIDVDFSNVTNMNSCFSEGNFNRAKKTTISIKVSKKCTSYSSTFYYCDALENMTFKEGSEIAASISFSNSSKLSYESLRSIINALGTVSSTKTLTLHATAKAKLSDSDIAEITQKGWTLA